MPVSLFRIALFSTIASIALTLAPAPASAQFFNIFRQRHYAPPPPPSSFAPDSRANPFEDFFGALFGRGPERIEDKTSGNVFAHYCVRTCDGKFFPVNSGGRGEASLAKVCNAMCPAADTAIYRGAGIENAVSADGKKYSALPNALAYRTRIVDNCSCNGRDPFGTVRVDIDNDPTLRAGDIVVQPEEIVVFRGTGATHTSGDFTPISNANVGAAHRKQLSDIRILQDNPHATFARTMPVMSAADAALQNPVAAVPPANANAPAAEPPARAN